MTLVSPDGLILFGPGSEWLWTLLQFVALTITFAAIFRQLRAQQAANQYEQMRNLRATWDDELFVRTRLNAMLELRYGLPAGQMTDDQNRIADFLDDLAGQEELGQLSTRYIWQFWVADVCFWWPSLAPSLELARARIGEPTTWIRFERLYRRMRAQQQRQGVQRDIDPELAIQSTGWIDGLIRDLRSRLAHLRDARAGVVPNLGRPGPAEVIDDGPEGRGPMGRRKTVRESAPSRTRG